MDFNTCTQMKTGKWFIKPVLPLTIFVKFGGILTALQHFIIVFCAQDTVKIYVPQHTDRF